MYALLAALLAATAAALVACPERYIPACLGGFMLWAECVLPSLFPFMVITLLFIKTGLAEKASLPLRRAAGIFKLPPAAAVCFIMSILSGYPAGARAVAEFYESGAIDGSDADKLAALCSTSGPLFVIGTVGYRMFSSKSAGWALLLCHALTVVCTALAFSLFSKKSAKRAVPRAVPDANALYNSFYGGVTAVAVTGGFIAFFYVLLQIAEDFSLFYPLQALFALFMDGKAAAALCRGIAESTAGCLALSKSGSPLALPLCGFVVTFGGISIVLQQLCYLTKAGVKPAKFIGVKLVQGVLCFLLLLPFQ